MEEKNGDCGTYLHGWMCSGAYMKMANFKPWLDADSIAAELNECGDPVSIKVSDEHRELEDVVEAIVRSESINPYATWLHPFFVGFETIECGWIVVAVDKVYYNNSFGDDTITAKMYEGDVKLLAD